ncbi:MAG: FAD-dependent oxidoreductase [Deltaproteobacteria bacterium]|nr:FAD-dependent oxidoreductase [Deltaproteobacteria bacterium]
MEKSDVIVIGGSAAGLTAALTSRRHYPEKEVLLVRREQQVLIPCGIPYIFGTVGSPEKNLIPDALLEKNGIRLLVTDATYVDRTAKRVDTPKGQLQFDRLVLATGSLPAMPPIPGFDLDGVFTIRKEIDYLRNLQQRLAGCRDVVIIGGGFIGIEFADEVRKMAGERTLSIVEALSHCLVLAYDDEFSTVMESHLRERGIHLYTSSRVDRILGDKTVKGLQLADGTKLKADAVILGIGAVANVELAKTAGLRLGPTGGIQVDRTMQTSDGNIFACGDCAEKTSFFGGRPSPLKLASIATLEARIAGANLFGLRRESPGTVGAWSTAVGDLALGTAGLTERMARDRGYQTVATTVEGPNRHPGSMPGACNTRLKLVFEAGTHVLLGGQIQGDAAIGEVVNLLSACVQQRMTVEDIAMFQAGTHPALTASPIAYALVNAAELAIQKMRGAARGA